MTRQKATHCTSDVVSAPHTRQSAPSRPATMSLNLRTHKESRVIEVVSEWMRVYWWQDCYQCTRELSPVNTQGKRGRSGRRQTRQRVNGCGSRCGRTDVSAHAIIHLSMLTHNASGAKNSHVARLSTMTAFAVSDCVLVARDALLHSKHDQFKACTAARYTVLHLALCTHTRAANISWERGQRVSIL